VHTHAVPVVLGVLRRLALRRNNCGEPWRGENHGEQEKAKNLYNRFLHSFLQRELDIERLPFGPGESIQFNDDNVTVA